MSVFSRFVESFESLQRFNEKWLPIIDDRSRSNDQRLAAYYLWVRHSISIGTISKLLAPQLLPDFAVICRGCIEYDVSLFAVMQEPSIAQEYLDFEKHAKSQYLRVLSKSGDTERLIDRRNEFAERFGKEPEQFKDSSWCHRHGGATGLLRKYDRNAEHRIYSMLSHFVHGSIEAMLLLDGKVADPVTCPLFLYQMLWKVGLGHR